MQSQLLLLLLYPSPVPLRICQRVHRRWLLQDVQDVLDDVLVLQTLAVLSRLRHDLLPSGVWRRHQTLYVLFSLRRVELARDHVTDGFEENVHLVRF